MSKIPVILLDVDGVLADWQGAVFKLFNSNLDTYNAPMPWEGGIEKWLSEFLKRPDINAITMWDRVNHHTAIDSFWSTLPKYPWAEELVQLCRRNCDQLIISSNPGLHALAHSQRLDWLTTHFGHNVFDGWMLGRHKALMANHKHVLIDDYTRNIDEFVNAGGWTVTFPQPWNRRHDIFLPSEKIQAVEADIETLKYAIWQQ